MKVELLHKNLSLSAKSTGANVMRGEEIRGRIHRVPYGFQTEHPSSNRTLPAFNSLMFETPETSTQRTMARLSMPKHTSRTRSDNELHI